MLEDRNAVANRLQRMIEKQIDTDELGRLSDENISEAKNVVKEKLSNVFDIFLGTLTENTQRELESLVLFYVNEKLPKLKTAKMQIHGNNHIKADYVINDVACDYIGKYIENHKEDEKASKDDQKQNNAKFLKKQIKKLHLTKKTEKEVMKSFEL